MCFGFKISPFDEYESLEISINIFQNWIDNFSKDSINEQRSKEKLLKLKLYIRDKLNKIEYNPGYDYLWLKYYRLNRRFNKIYLSNVNK